MGNNYPQLEIRESLVLNASSQCMDKSEPKHGQP